MSTQRYRKGVSVLPAHQYGLSLVELMIAVTLGLFLTWGVIQAFLSGKQAYSLQQSLSRIQESGRLAQVFVDGDIRMSGDYGCGSNDSFLTVDTAIPLPSQVTSCGDARINLINDAATNALNDFGSVVYGYNNVTADPCGCLSPDPVSGTDVLVLHPTSDIGVLNAAVDMNTMPSSLDIVPLSFTDTNNKFVAVGDCANVRIFQINDTGNVASGSPGTLSCSQPGVKMAQGATVKRIDTVIYYVALDTANSNMPTLYRYSQADGLTEALLPGVEDMQIEFGVDNDRDNNIDIYAAPDVVASGAWSAWDGTGTAEVPAVRAVRYALLIRAEDPVLSESQTLVYPPFVAGASVTKTDKKLRMVFPGTVGLRSRTVAD